MPAALPAVAAWAAAAWSSAVTVTAVGLTKVGVMAAIGEGATIALAGKMVAAGATMALSAGAAALMRPNTPSSGTTLDFKPDPKAPVRGVMGYAAVGGSKVFQATWGYKKVAMSLGVALSLGPIDQVTQFRADDAVVAFAGPQNEATGFYAADMWQRTTTGLPTDAALLPPTGLKYGNPALTGWGTQHAAPGVAFAFWTMVLAKNPEDRDIFTNGVPDPRWVGRWMKVWDPRKDSTYPGGSGPQRRDDWRTWTWSENPYVHALAWVRGWHKMNADGSLDRSKRIAGIGAPDAAIDMAAFVEGMNVAEANAWAISGEWSTSDSKFQTLVAMLQAGGGEPISRGAQISVMVNAPRVATYTYTRDDLIGAAEVRTSTPRRERKNTIIPRYRSEAHGWEYVPAGEVTSQVYRTEDRGEPRSLEVEYSLVRHAKQAGQLAAYDLANLREGLTATLPSRAHLMHVHPGDCIMVDLPEVALANQKFLVRRATANHQSATVTLELRAESDAKHAWALGQVANPPPSPGLSAVDPKYVPPPPAENWVITPRPPSQDGTSQPVIVIEGVVDTGDVTSVIIEYGVSVDGPWTVGYTGPPMADGRYEITGVEPTTDYWVSVRYIARNGAISDRLISGPVTAGGLIAGDIHPDSPAWDAIVELIGTGDGFGEAIAAAEARQQAALADAKALLKAADAATDAALSSADTRLTAGLNDLSAALDDLALEDLEGFQAYSANIQSALDGKATNGQLNGLATRVTTAEGSLTAQNNRLNTVETNLAGKASATDLSNLTTRVTNAEGVNVAQNTRLNTVEADVAGKASASSLTDLSASVAVRNRTFRQAAQPTNPVGGYPLVAGDRWINTTSGKNNEEKAWTGSAWVDIADPRVAALSTQVTTLDAKVSGHQTAIADLQSGKANASDLTSLTSRVTSAEGVNTAQNTRLNTVETDVAGKASASSVSDLSASVAVRNRTFRQAAQPTNPIGGYPLVAGDRWINTTSGKNNEEKAWTGSAWVDIADPRVAALSTQVTTLDAKVSGHQTAIADLQSGKANASDLSSLTSRVTSAEGVNTAQNTRLNTVEADVAGKASASSVSDLSASVAVRNRTFRQTAQPTNPIGGYPLVAGDRWINTTSGKNNEEKAWTGSAWVDIADPRVAALSTQVTTLDSKVTGHQTAIADLQSGKANASDLSSLTSRVTSAEGVNTAQNTRLNTVETDVAGKASASSVSDLSASVAVRNRTFRQTAQPTNPIGGYPLVAGDRWINTTTGKNNEEKAWTGSAWVDIADPRVAALSTQVTTLDSKVTGHQTAIADLQSGKASASSVTALTATVNGHTASITSVQQVAAAADGKANSIVGIVQDVNGKATGFASVNNGTTSSFDVRSDKFTVSSPSGGARTEFSTGTWRIYDANNRLRVRMGVW